MMLPVAGIHAVEMARDAEAFVLGRALETEPAPAPIQIEEDPTHDDPPAPADAGGGDEESDRGGAAEDADLPQPAAPGPDADAAAAEPREPTAAEGAGTETEGGELTPPEPEPVPEPSATGRAPVIERGEATVTRAGADRDWWCPSVGEQVLLLSPDGEPNQGWVLPAAFSDAHPAPDNDPARHVVAYADGMRIVHEPGRLILDGWDAEGAVEIRAKNIVVKMAEGGFYHLDLAGMATRTTHLGGSQFKTESWSTGTVVTAQPNQPFHPPEVETP